MPAIYTKECVGCKVLFTSKWLRAQFCSKSCSNKTRPRRTKKIAICDFEGCNNEVDYYTHRFCRTCKDMKRHHMAKRGGKLYSEMTISDFVVRKGANKFDSIRGAARTLFRNLENKCCEECGWSHHVEVCHITPICDFDLNTTIDVVNDMSNLRLLCPNCHWLFDNKKIHRVGLEPTKDFHIHTRL